MKDEVVNSFSLKGIVTLLLQKTIVVDLLVPTLFSKHTDSVG